jgi:hypothetical protein
MEKELPILLAPPHRSTHHRYLLPKRRVEVHV